MDTYRHLSVNKNVIFAALFELPEFMASVPSVAVIVTVGAVCGRQ